MSDQNFPGFSRRRVLQVGVAAGVTAAIGSPLLQAAAAGAPILRKIPSTGEQLPVIGTGTNAFGVADSAELEAIRGVLREMPGLGAKVVDTARGYGSSEEVIGKLLAELGNRDKIFLATKTPLAGDISGGAAVLEESFKRLQVSKIDLLQIHNIHGLNELMPHFIEYKKAGKIRYIGCTTSVEPQYPQMLDAMHNHKLDFIQVNYSIGNRGADAKILPMARDMGIAVLTNVPFGGRGRTMFPRVQGKPLPDFAKEIGAETWAQFFLKYIIGNPAITATIPGSTTVEFLRDNQTAGRGVVPDAAMRKRMEAYWDALPG
jgi:aryl-alcohol dehydrogenase-like predicted oxidoreductase